MSVKQFVQQKFQSSEYKKDIPNHADKLRKWQWWGDMNGDHLLTVDDLKAVTKKDWKLYDSKGDGHCFYNALHRFLLENKLYETERQRSYEKGQQEGIPDRDSVRPNILKNGKEGKKKYDPPILYLRKKILQSILRKKKYVEYVEKKKMSVDENDVKKKYIGIMKDKGFFGSEESSEIMEGFFDAKKYKQTGGWVNFGQVAVAALVLKINIMVWSVRAQTWTPFYAHLFNYDQDEQKNRDTLREEPVCFMNFNGSHYQNLVPLVSQEQSSINHELYSITYNTRLQEKRKRVKQVLAELEEMEERGNFKRIPATENTNEKKEKWVWDRMMKRNWVKKDFLDDYGKKGDDEWLCKECRSINDNGYKECPTCQRTTKKKGKELETKIKKGTAVQFYTYEKKSYGENKRYKYTDNNYVGFIKAKYKKANKYKITVWEDEKKQHFGHIPRKDITIIKEKKNDDDSDGWKDAITEFTGNEQDNSGNTMERNVIYNSIIKNVFHNLVTKDVKGDGYCMLNAMNALSNQNITKAQLQEWAPELDEEKNKNNEPAFFQTDLSGNVSNLGRYWLPVLAKKSNSRIIVFARAHNTNNYSLRVEEYPGKSTSDGWPYDNTYLLYNTAHYWPLKSSQGELTEERITEMRNSFLYRNEK